MILPKKIITKIEEEAFRITHGKIILEIHIRDNQSARFVITKQESILPSDILEV